MSKKSIIIGWFCCMGASLVASVLFGGKGDILLCIGGIIVSIVPAAVFWNSNGELPDGGDYL